MGDPHPPPPSLPVTNGVLDSVRAFATCGRSAQHLLLENGGWDQLNQWFRTGIACRDAVLLGEVLQVALDMPTGCRLLEKQATGLPLSVEHLVRRIHWNHTPEYKEPDRQRLKELSLSVIVRWMKIRKLKLEEKVEKEEGKVITLGGGGGMLVRQKNRPDMVFWAVNGEMKEVELVVEDEEDEMESLEPSLNETTEKEEPEVVIKEEKREVGKKEEESQVRKKEEPEVVIDNGPEKESEVVKKAEEPEMVKENQDEMEVMVVKQAEEEMEVEKKVIETADDLYREVEEKIRQLAEIDRQKMEKEMKERKLEALEEIKKEEDLCISNVRSLHPVPVNKTEIQVPVETRVPVKEKETRVPMEEIESRAPVTRVVTPMPSPTEAGDDSTDSFVLLAVHKESPPPPPPQPKEEKKHVRWDDSPQLFEYPEGEYHREGCVKENWMSILFSDSEDDSPDTQNPVEEENEWERESPPPPPINQMPHNPFPTFTNPPPPCPQADENWEEDEEEVLDYVPRTPSGSPPPDEAEERRSYTPPLPFPPAPTIPPYLLPVERVQRLRIAPPRDPSPPPKLRSPRKTTRWDPAPPQPQPPQEEEVVTPTTPPALQMEWKPHSLVLGENWKPLVVKSAEAERHPGHRERPFPEVVGTDRETPVEPEVDKNEDIFPPSPPKVQIISTVDVVKRKDVLEETSVYDWRNKKWPEPRSGGPLHKQHHHNHWNGSNGRGRGDTRSRGGRGGGGGGRGWKHWGPDRRNHDNGNNHR